MQHQGRAAVVVGLAPGQQHDDLAPLSVEARCRAMGPSGGLSIIRRSGGPLSAARAAKIRCNIPCGSSARSGLKPSCAGRSRPARRAAAGLGGHRQLVGAQDRAGALARQGAGQARAGGEAPVVIYLWGDTYNFLALHPCGTERMGMRPQVMCASCRRTEEVNVPALLRTKYAHRPWAEVMPDLRR